MPKKPPPVNPIRTLLLQGRSVPQVSAKLGVSTSRIYAFAKKHDLPTNRTVYPGSRLEAQIVEATFFHSAQAACRLFKLAAPCHKTLIDAVKARFKARTA